MIRIAGAALLMLAGGLFAYGKVSAMKEHLRMLSSLISALGVMTCEIRVNLTPLGELIEGLADPADPYAGAFFENVFSALRRQGAPYFSRCWRDAATACCSCLRAEEQTALCELGEVLGRYDTPEECAAIDRCVQTLKSAYDALRMRYSTDARLYTGLGLAAGCILAIVFL